MRKTCSFVVCPASSVLVLSVVMSGVSVSIMSVNQQFYVYQSCMCSVLACSVYISRMCFVSSVFGVPLWSCVNIHRVYYSGETCKVHNKVLYTQSKQTDVDTKAPSTVSAHTGHIPLLIRIEHSSLSYDPLNTIILLWYTKGSFGVLWLDSCKIVISIIFIIICGTFISMLHMTHAMRT